MLLILIAVVSASDACAQQNPSFQKAFSDLEMDEHQTSPSPETMLAAKKRYKNAPVEISAIGTAKPLGIGAASYYGKRFAGRLTANGEIFDSAKLTAAHRSLPFGTRVKVTNQRNGKSVIVRINDRGPFYGNRVIDLSREAARQIGLNQQGHGPVKLEQIIG